MLSHHCQHPPHCNGGAFRDGFQARKRLSAYSGRTESPRAVHRTSRTVGGRDRAVGRPANPRGHAPGRVAGGTGVAAARDGAVARLAGRTGGLGCGLVSARHSPPGIPAAAGPCTSCPGDPRQLLGRRGNRLPRCPCRADGGSLLPTEPRVVWPSPLSAGKDAGFGRGGCLGHRWARLVARPEPVGRNALGRPAASDRSAGARSGDGNDPGARALGWEQDVGSLAPGKQADLAIVALPGRDSARPHELLFASDGPVVACYFRGMELYSQTVAQPEC